MEGHSREAVHPTTNRERREGLCAEFGISDPNGASKLDWSVFTQNVPASANAHGDAKRPAHSVALVSA
jgi:hypothetical protein